VPLTPQQLADFQRLRQSYAPVVEAQRRKQKAYDNLEKMHGLPPVKPQPKADGGSANLDQFLEGSHTPMRLYHGTTATEGGKRQEALRRLKPSKEGAFGPGVYMTPDTEYASGYTGVPAMSQIKRDVAGGSDYARAGATKMLNRMNKGEVESHEVGGNMLPLHARTMNPLVVDMVGPGDPNVMALMMMGVSKDKAYDIVEKAYEKQGGPGKHVYTRAKALGHDAMIIKRNGKVQEVIHWNPKMIKSATGNRGTYDTTKDDLSMAKGGPVMGINVASDRKAGIHYADLIVDGKKTIETRNSDTLRPYVGKRVAIVRTGSGPAKAIGEVTIGEPMVANKAKFRAMQSKHMVPEGSMFDITTPTKHLYPLHSPVRYDNERDVGHGIVSRKVIHEAKGGSVEPKKTVKAYKLFRVHPDHPGKLFPLFVDANTPVEMNKWVDAKEGEMANGKVKSKIGALAYRPGWHAGDLPIATHIGEKSDPKLTAPDRRPANHAWAEVEMPDDVDWQSEATRRGTNAQGKVIPVKSHITDQIPKGGHYRYKTNPNMTGNWLIGGSMKVNKVLTDAEVKSINKAAGMADLPRAQPFKKKTFGFAGGGCVGPQEWMAEEHVNHMAKGGKAKFLKDSKVKDVLYRGGIGHKELAPDFLEGKPRAGYATFASTSPHVAGSYAHTDEGESEHVGGIAPMHIKAHTLHEFPVTVDKHGSRNFDKFAFDRFARRLEPGHAVVARQVIDYGPRASTKTDPERRYSYPSDIYAWNKGTETKSALSKAKGGRVTHAHHLEIEERPL
jgi:hypothetical protein